MAGQLAGSVATDVTKRSGEDVGDKVSLSGKRFETGFKRKRGALLLRSGSQRKVPFQLRPCANRTPRMGYSRRFGWEHLRPGSDLSSPHTFDLPLPARPGLSEALHHSREVSLCNPTCPAVSEHLKPRGHFSFRWLGLWLSYWG